MISSCSQLWWQEFSIAGVVAALASCSSGSTSTTEPVEVDEPGSVRGELWMTTEDWVVRDITAYFKLTLRSGSASADVVGEVRGFARSRRSAGA